MKRGIVAAVAALFLSVSFGAATAQMDCKSGMMGGGMGMMGMGGGMMGEGHHLWRHLMDLGLDSKQKSAIHEIRNRTMKASVRMRADMQIAAIELDDVLDREPVDMKSAEAALRRMEALRTDIRMAHIKAKKEIMAILSPEQKKKLSDLMQRRPMRGGMGKRGMGMRPGMMRGMGMMQGSDCGPCGMMGGMGGGMMMAPDMDEMDYETVPEEASHHSSPDMDMKGDRDGHHH
ncbi:MAG: periplasmic heavy metal sensor [Nitrospirales bacterium]|nr:periplasmic heavy metal sensor [Nitrospirales bacterium]